MNFLHSTVIEATIFTESRQDMTILVVKYDARRVYVIFAAILRLFSDLQTLIESPT